MLPNLRYGIGRMTSFGILITPTRNPSISGPMLNVSTQLDPGFGIRSSTLGLPINSAVPRTSMLPIRSTLTGYGTFLWVGVNVLAQEWVVLPILRLAAGSYLVCSAGPQDFLMACTMD